MVNYLNFNWKFGLQNELVINYDEFKSKINIHKCVIENYNAISCATETSFTSIRLVNYYLV